MKNIAFFRLFLACAFCLSLCVQSYGQGGFAVSIEPESYPNAHDGTLTVKINSSNYQPPFVVRLKEEDKDPIEVVLNTGDALFTGLTSAYYCLTVISGENCQGIECFDFPLPCLADDCLIADFVKSFTNDGCTLNFIDISEGNPKTWLWDFGDGTTSTLQNPSHIFSSSGCYNVSLKVTNGTLTRTIIKEVCLISCTGDSAPAPNCEINGVTVAAAGQLISLSVAGMGLGPFEANWAAPSDANIISNSGTSIIAQISNTVDNGDELLFSVDLFDFLGNSTSCTHVITIGGNTPDVEVAAFGSFEENKPLVLVAFADIFNLTGPEDYYFTLTPANANNPFNPQGTCLNQWLPTYECDLLNGVPEGHYELCVNVRDQAGTYAHCMSIVIGNPGPFIPDPLMWLEVKPPTDNPKKDNVTGNYIVEEGTPIFLGLGALSSWDNGCNSDDYSVVLHYENITLETSTHSPGDIVTFAPPDCFCNGCFRTYNNGLNWKIQESVQCGHMVFRKGTVKITADVYKLKCDGTFLCEDPLQPYTTPPIYIDFYPAKPLIAKIDYDDKSCSLPFSVTMASDCPISSYEWHVYDKVTDQEISNFFQGNTNASVVYPDLSHELYNKYPSGSTIKLRVKVIVVDINGFTSEMSTFLELPIPLRIGTPAQLNVCPNTWSKFADGSIAIGRFYSYEYTWSVLQPVGGSLNFQSNDPHDADPTFYMTNAASKVYHLVVKSKNLFGDMECIVEKDITVSTSSVSLNLPDITIPVCREGGKKIGPTDPTNLGGSGQYSFLWSCSNPAGLNYLSNIHVSNPLISGIPAEESIIYTLTVTDLLGGCTTSDELTVVSVANNISVTLPSSTTVCYGEEVTITGNVNPFSQIYHEWTTNHPKPELVQNGGNGPKKQLTFSEIMCSYPGTYNITLKATDIVSGCTAEATTSLTVRSPWRYVGYVSKIASATKNSSMPLWEPGSNNYFTSNPPNLNNIEVSWHPYPPHQGSITYYGNTALPSNGSFTPTKEVPFLTMTVYDNVSGCSKTVRTMRYIISEYEPRLNIFAGNGASCIGDPVCFDLVFDAQLADYTTPLLPDHITAMVTIHAPNNVPQQPDSKGIPVKLLLENSSGLYKAKVCETDFFQYETFNEHHYTASLSMGNGIWSNVESASVEVAVNEISTPSGHIIKCLPNNGNNNHERALSYRFGLQCTGSAVHNAASYTFARDYIELLPDNDLELIPGTLAGSYNRGAYLGIDPCIIPQAVGDSPNSLLSSVSVEERSTSTDSSQTYPLLLDVFPNPFEDEVNIEFHIPKDCAGRTSIVLYDIMGKEKAIVYLQENCLSGVHQTRFKTDNIPSGIYFCELKTCIICVFLANW